MEEAAQAGRPRMEDRPMSKKRPRTRRAPAVTTQELPEVVTQEPPPTEERDPTFYAPAGAVCYYQKRHLTHCPRCRRVRRDDKSQATVTTGIKDDVAYLRCRCCGHRFAAPVR